MQFADASLMAKADPWETVRADTVRPEETKGEGKKQKAYSA